MGAVMFNLISGGFLSGYRTYILGGLLAVTALGQWAVGDLSTQQLFDQLPHVLEGLGLMALRKGVADSAAGK